MLIIKPLLILMISCQILALVQPCTPSTICQGQSYCDTNQAYCVCNQGFIGSCNVTAPLINSTNSTVYNILVNQQLLFSINPTQLNVYIQYTLQICTNVSSLLIVANLWQQNGYMTDYNQSNQLVQPTSFSLGSTQCLQLLTPFIMSGQQPNGQNQLIIFGISDFSLINATLTLSVQQQVVQGIKIEFYIIIGISSLVVVLIIITVIYILCRRRRRMIEETNKKQSQYNDIQYFKDYMPLINASQLQNQKPICPICLQQIQSAQVIRRTPCQHIFHSNCLDSWCLKALSCPVCRNSLALQTFAQRSMKRNSQISRRISNNTYYHWQDNDVEHIQMGMVNMNNNVRENML